MENEKMTKEDKPLEIRIELDDEVANEFFKYLKKQCSKMKHVEEQLFENDLQYGKYKMEIKERVQIRVEMDDEIADQVNRWIAEEKIKVVIAINDVEIDSVKKIDS